MFVIVGWVVALACIFGVYIAEEGNIAVILHALPWELITIFGAAGGAFLANNQMKRIKRWLKGVGAC
ncbi:MAG: flagellar motor stator protein MotA, partial [Caulobacter sp.]|nr:flagellar motor stator protein MotA [Vitreoscilla sp.]